MILFMKGEWKLKILLDFAGFYRKPQETAGNHRKWKEMLKSVGSSSARPLGVMLFVVV